MLFLSVLIMLALAVAVASFLISDGLWLVALSAGLVLLAFYASRRPSKSRAELEAEANDGRPTRERLVITIDNGIIDFESSGRQRDSS